MIGKVLGPYSIIAHLGSGAMGSVYLAESEGTQVAVKVLHHHLLDRPGYFKRFQQEVVAGRRVNHPNVVRTLDGDMHVIDDVPHCYLVMEYVKGRSLKDLLVKTGPLPVALLKDVARQIAEGLSAIHDQEIVHRDLKPANIIVTQDHTVKLMDLGVARLKGDIFRISQTGQFVGSLLYAAPEQIRGDGLPLDGRTDLFSFGIILYELATGQNPFGAANAHDVMHRIVSKDPPPPREMRQDLPASVEALILRLLEKLRNRRFASARDFLAELRAPGESTVIPAAEAPARPKPRKMSIPRETMFHGRDGPLKALQAAWAGVLEGNGGVVLVQGGVGLGKTRLVDEFAARLRSDGEDFEFLFGSYPPGGAASGIQAFAAALSDRFPENVVREELTRLLGRAPSLVDPLQATLRGEPPLMEGVPLQRESLFTAFSLILHGLAEDRPVVLLIDDLHFSPGDGLALFASLAFSVPEHRVLLIGTTRHGLPDTWWANLGRLEHVSHILLERLTSAAVERIVSDALRSETSLAILGQRIYERSDGNPLFILEILRDLKEKRILEPGLSGEWIATGRSGDIPIPSTVARLVEARFSELSEEERSLFEVAACCGFEFSPLVVAAALDIPRIEGLRALSRAERQHGLILATGRTYTFEHHQLQETLYESISESLREAYHARIAAALEKVHGAGPGGGLAAQICEHHCRGGAPENALERLESALEHLQQCDHHERAANLARDVLDVRGLVEGADRVDLLLRLADSLQLSSRMEETKSIVEKAVTLADRLNDQARGARARTKLGSVLENLGQAGEACEILREAVAQAEAAGDPVVEAAAVSTLGNSLSEIGEIDEAEICYERGLKVAEASDDLKGQGSAIGNLAHLSWWRGDLPRAQKGAERALELMRRVGDRKSEASIIGMLGLIFDDLGLFVQAAEMHLRHLAIACDLGYRRGEAIATSNLGDSIRMLGRLDEARRHFEISGRISAEIGDLPGVASSHINMGAIETQLGRISAARDSLSRALAVSRETNSLRQEAESHLALARIELQDGNHAEARAQANSALAIHRQIGFESGTGWALLALGRSLGQLGKAEEAREALDEAVRIGRGAGVAQLLVLGTCHLATAGGVEVEEAASVLKRNETRLDTAERIEAGLALWRAGGGDEFLRTSHELLKELMSTVTEEQGRSMREGVPLYRELLEVWPEAGSR